MDLGIIVSLLKHKRSARFQFRFWFRFLVSIPAPAYNTKLLNANHTVNSKLEPSNECPLVGLVWFALCESRWMFTVSYTLVHRLWSWILVIGLGHKLVGRCMQDFR